MIETKEKAIIFGRIRQSKENKGITLTVLVITIIILLILAGVSINLMINSGIIKKAQDAVKKWEIASLEEELELAIVDIQLEKGNDFKREDLKELDKIGAPVDDPEAIPTEGEYKDHYFEVDEDYNVTMYENGGIEKPEITIKDVAFGQFTIEINKNYDTKEIKEFVYYIEGKVVHKGTRDMEYTATGLKGREYTNIYVIAKADKKRNKSNVCSVTVPDSVDLIEEMQEAGKTGKQMGFFITDPTTLEYHSGGGSWSGPNLDDLSMSFMATNYGSATITFGYRIPEQFINATSLEIELDLSAGFPNYAGVGYVGFLRPKIIYIPETRV